MGLTVDEKQHKPVVKRDKVGLERKERKERRRRKKNMKYKKTRTGTARYTVVHVGN